MNINDLVCCLCSKILKRPIQLEKCSCKKKLNVCKEHLISINEKLDTFACSKCQHVYDLSLPLVENDLLSKNIQEFIYLNDQEKEIKFSTEKLLKELEVLISDFNGKMEEFSLTQADHFENLRRDIDIRREMFIQELVRQRNDEKIKQLNANSEKMIEKVEKFEREFRQNFDQNVKPNLIGFNLNQAQIDLDELLRETEYLLPKLNANLEFYRLKLKDLKQRCESFQLYEYDLKKCKLLDDKLTLDNDLGKLVFSSVFFRQQEEILNVLIDNPIEKHEMISLNFNTGYAIKTFNIGEYSRLCFSQDSSKLVSISNDLHKVWNVLTGKCLFAQPTFKVRNF
jgi:hypothetical protein